MATTPAQAGYYPPLNFHFRVNFADRSDVKKPEGSTAPSAKEWDSDIYFQSVSGLGTQIQTETIKEGGENRFEHVVPMRAKSTDIVLKRGIFPANSPLTKWVQQAMSDFIFEPKDLIIQLLDENHAPLLVWNVRHAWPKNWKIDELNAEQGKVLIETLELTCNTFKMSNG